jgi:hypothetical protein
MGINYTVLKSSVIYSTIWAEDAETCKVWITLLVMRNKNGEIFSSLPGLAHIARINPEKTALSVQKFLAPDPASTTKDFEGRRIVEIPGGWRLLNHDKIKKEAAAANKAAYMADYMRSKRAHARVANSLPEPGEREYLEAIEREATPEELDEIVNRHLPQSPPAPVTPTVGTTDTSTP